MIQKSQPHFKTSKTTHHHKPAPSPSRRQMTKHNLTSHYSRPNCHLNHPDNYHQHKHIQIDHDRGSSSQLLPETTIHNKAAMMNYSFTTTTTITINHQIRIPTTTTTTATSTSTTSATTITTARSKISTNKERQSLSNHFMRNVFIIILLNFTLSHLKNSIHHKPTAATTTSRIIEHLNIFETLPRIVQVAALATPPATECATNDDCGDNKICLDNKCTCHRDNPIEDKDQSRCLNLAVFGEPCQLDDQCLGNTKCLLGLCSCPNESVTIFNPSSKINYCHPKRRLNEECSHDTQCPENAFCANKGGCLCQNGYGSQIVKSDGLESNQCLAKLCSSSSDCESEFHQCEENRCKCLATHFDPHTAQCYMFGSTGGKPIGEDADNSKANLSKSNTDTTLADNDDDDISFTSILNDLTGNGDRMWLVILILIVSTVLLVLLVFLLVRRHYRGYCWTKHKIGYEPNNANNNNQSKRENEVGDGGEGGSLFNKNSITNKSFRRMKDEETDDYDTLTRTDEEPTIKSNLVTSSNKNTKKNNKRNNNKDGALLINQNVFVSSANGASSNNNNNNMSGHNNDNHEDGGHVKVDMNHVKRKDVDGLMADVAKYDVDGNNHKRQTTTRDQITNGYYNQAPFHQVVSPLASSTSTPV